MITMTPEQEFEHLQNIAAKTSELFTDYVVICRVKDGLVWKYSDRTFMIGAATRLCDRLKNEERFGMEKGAED